MALNTFFCGSQDYSLITHRFKRSVLVVAISQSRERLATLAAIFVVTAAGGEVGREGGRGRGAVGSASGYSGHGQRS